MIFNFLVGILPQLQIKFNLRFLILLPIESNITLDLYNYLLLYIILLKFLIDIYFISSYLILKSLFIRA